MTVGNIAPLLHASGWAGHSCQSPAARWGQETGPADLRQADNCAARPFFFFPQTAGVPGADHNIMDTPDINFSAVLLPSAAARPAADAAPGPAALARDRAARR
jgi:hypothetical protein